MGFVSKSLERSVRDWAATDFQDTSLLEPLGVHLRDKEGAKKLSCLAERIAKGEFSSFYEPHNQLVTYRDDKGHKVALFKVGTFRADLESAARRLTFLMGANCVVPSMHATFDFSELSQSLLAMTLNSEPFLERSSPKKGDRKALLSEFSFAIEEYPSGIRLFYLPAGGEKVCRDTPLKLQGTFGGVLEPYTQFRETSFTTWSEMVVVGALLGMRDFQEDAASYDTLHDCEEVMPVEVKSSGAKELNPSLNMPILGKDPRALSDLRDEDKLWVKKFADQLNIDLVVDYARNQKMLFRNRELEEAALKSCFDSKDKKTKKCYFVEKSEREPKYFPRIPLEEENLFSQEQVEAFKNRLTRFKEAFSLLKKEEVKNWPKMNLWGIVNIIDPDYGSYCEELRSARARTLSEGDGDGDIPSKLIRLYWLDSPSDDSFTEAMAGAAGRVPLTPSLFRRRRAASDSIGNQGSEDEKSKGAAMRPHSFHFEVSPPRSQHGEEG